ncbi:BA14K family protein [Bradyrhizobium sp. NP1]|uniref:BA14K family protein n=1 Tax=Bradyrhizobium sp. NP1 TaxID=3049772 RepID=UPI0025A57093|nr:BA14K family protein [Bradyrhizobium sp. NP1]WJR75172.1 BA14K family protein [Bradyrhizobium sp. NP1]
MTSKTFLSTVAALALLVPVMASTASYAQADRVGGGRGAVSAGAHAGGGAGMRAGGGGGMRAGGGGGGMRVGTAPTMGGGAPAARFAAGPVDARPGGAAWSGGGRTWSGGRTAWNGGGGYRHNRGWWPGAVAAGAVAGAAIAAGDSYAYYGGPDYYDDNGGVAYYDGGYVDDGAVAVVGGGGADPAYCAQRYRSYDPASGTYLGYDGMRHPCP